VTPDSPSLVLRNAQAAPITRLPCLPVSQFREQVIQSVRAGARLAALHGFPGPEDHVQLLAVMAHASEGFLRLIATNPGDRYPALTPDCPAAQGFERELAEQWGVLPEGHPWLKPLRFASPHPGRTSPWPARGEADAADPPALQPFTVNGTEVHEVAVGPVHAGVIEPGHFRFQCHGEHVLHLEISLGYQHRGVERALVGGPNARTHHYFETLAGDTTIGHATAGCEILEALGGCAVPIRAQALRGVALELERLANHTGDLGAMAADVGFLPTAAWCGRLRGDFLNLTALVCGNRFGRGWVRSGGCAVDLDVAMTDQLQDRLDTIGRDTLDAVNLLWNTSSVRSRFENTGPVSTDAAVALGLVGPAARACGLERDVRREFPSGIYRFFQIPTATSPHGHVFGRALVRGLELERSLAFVRDQLRTLPSGPVRQPAAIPAPDHVAVSLVEGWRGEICHVAITGAQGRFRHYKVVDPSFHNWIGLALALRNQQISDFPLCNKSFNLSYCGHDL
jgi:Ni,Fe-hydrogenase III large subunit